MREAETALAVGKLVRREAKIEQDAVNRGKIGGRRQFAHLREIAVGQ